MLTKYFGEYKEKNPNAIPANEYECYVHLRKIKNNYYPFVAVDGKSYDMPKFVTPYTNRKIAFIGRKYTREKNGIAYNKFVVIVCKPVDRLHTVADELEEIEMLEVEDIQ